MDSNACIFEVGVVETDEQTRRMLLLLLLPIHVYVIIDVISIFILVSQTGPLASGPV